MKAITNLISRLSRSSVPKAMLVVALGIFVLPGCGVYILENVAPNDQDGDGLTDREEAQYGTDPYDADTDGDGLYDDEEIYDYGTDPLILDTDDDDLWDAEEVFDYFTDPLHWDSDGDGVSDGLEVQVGRDPLRFDRARR